MPKLIGFFNFPYDAVEEALSNAVYHKRYELGSPIEVQVWPDKIEILSYPGPVPPVNSSIVRNRRRIVAREYRNRRIGDFLKELRLTEGRGTGFPTIYKAMDDNGSPTPIFETDDDTYFLVTLPAHVIPDRTGNQASNQVNLLIFNNLQEIIDFGNGAGNGAGRQASTIISEEIHDRVAEMLGILRQRMKRVDVFEQMDLSNQSKNRARYLDPLIDLDWVAMEYPDETTHPNQTYQITEAGKRILALISNGNEVII